MPLAHEEEGAQAVEVVGGPVAGDVVRVVADVGADGDVGRVVAHHDRKIAGMCPVVPVPRLGRKRGGADGSRRGKQTK